MSSFRVFYFAALSWAMLAASQTLTADSGAISSSPGNAASSSGTSSLPWKFLAKPMGTLELSYASGTIRAMGDADNWDCKQDPKKSTPRRVEELIKKTTGKDISQTATYVVIHWVDYGSGVKDPSADCNPKNAGADNATTTASDSTTEQQALRDGWYVYRSKSNWNYQKFISQRIYGSKDVLFLFVHLNVASADKDTIQNAMPDAGISDPAKKAALFESARLGDSIIRVPGAGSETTQWNICAKDTLAPMRFVGDDAVPFVQANVHYESAVVKRTPANVANFLNVLKLLGLAHADMKCINVKTTAKALWGVGEISSIGLPSDVTIAGYRLDTKPKEEERASLQLGSIGAFNDEQLYWWDASIGLPVHKIKDLNYSVSDDTVVASQVDKQSAYALFNLMLYPADLAEPESNLAKSNLVPRLLVGFPLSSNPWDRLFAGAGMGLPIKQLRYFQFFAGVTFNRSKQPETLQPGDPANNGQLQNDLKIKMTPKFTFGINVPVKSVFDQLMR